jgi:hypothetical protein
MTQALAPKPFYDGLIAELDARRAAIAPAKQSFGPPRKLSRTELVEWLKFQAWYELEAAGFIGSWLDGAVDQPVAFQGLARQVADEARHYRLFLRHLESFGGTLEGWVPEPEWVAWVSEFYRAGNDTIERVAAHNITGELGAMQAFESLLPRVPDATKRLLRKVMPDERFHAALGRTVVQRYATTVEAQARVRHRVLRAFELEQAGRAAYERRMAALAA